MKLKQTFGSSDFISLRFDMLRQSRRYMYMFTHILGIKTTLKWHYKQIERIPKGWHEATFSEFRRLSTRKVILSHAIKVNQNVFVIPTALIANWIESSRLKIIFFYIPYVYCNIWFWQQLFKKFILGHHINLPVQ